MLYPNIEEIMKIIVEEGVKIVLLGWNLNMDILPERKWYYGSSCCKQ
jgi:hypothetical protein